MRNKHWMSLKKSSRKLSTRKSANKTTEYLNVFLMMREHRINRCFMPYKRAQLISSDNIPPLHRNELSVFHKAVQPHYYIENMPSKVNLNSLSSPEVMMHSCLLGCEKARSLTIPTWVSIWRKLHGRSTIINKRS